MICLNCGRILKSEKSQKLGYGPVCYRKKFGNTRETRNKTNNSSADEIPYYDIPGQMKLEDFLSPESEW